MTDIEIRGVEATDIPFLYATWLKSYESDSLTGKSVKRSIFFENYRLVVDQILEKNTTKIYIACSKDDPKIIYGYLVAEPTENILHYVFVKEAFRRFGIAKDLFIQAFPEHSEGVVNITHRTNSMQFIVEKFTYNPFLLWKIGDNNV